MASEGLHEPGALLDEATVDHHRAMTSLCEELEAIDWYHQRVKATSDTSLAAVLAHNRDDEKEHAAMTLEWLRRHDPELDANSVSALSQWKFRPATREDIPVELEAIVHIPFHAVAPQ